MLIINNDLVACLLTMRKCIDVQERAFTALVGGEAEGRTGPDQITFFRNVGNQGLQFSAIGQIVYAKALAPGEAREVPTETSLQDIRD